MALAEGSAMPMLRRCFTRQWAGLDPRDQEHLAQYPQRLPAFLRYGGDRATSLWEVVTPTQGTLVLLSLKEDHMVAG